MMKEVEELRVRTRRLEEALTAKEKELEEVRRGMNELKPHYEFIMWLQKVDPGLLNDRKIILKIVFKDNIKR